jgi:hypothetical protein
MAPSNPDNSPIPEPVTFYVPVIEIERLRQLNARLVRELMAYDPAWREELA